MSPGRDPDPALHRSRPSMPRPSRQVPSNSPDPRSLGPRSRAPHARRDLRRRRIPTPRGQRSSGDGDLPQPCDQSTPPQRMHQHRRRRTSQRPHRRPTERVPRHHMIRKPTSRLLAEALSHISDTTKAAPDWSSLLCVNSQDKAPLQRARGADAARTRTWIGAPRRARPRACSSESDRVRPAVARSSKTIGIDAS